MANDPSTKQIENLINLYISKSKEAFLLAVEIMNKPTINYRIECYSFLICNAWELILKCLLIKDNGLQSIKYKRDPDRSLSLSDCLIKFFPNENNNIRCNLEFIINNIRDQSTHSVLVSHEGIFMPILQASALNYIKFINDNLGDDSLNNINLFYWSNLKEDINYEQIESLYGQNLRQLLILSRDKKEEYINRTLNNDDNYYAFAEVTINYSRIKNNNKSDIVYAYGDTGYNKISIENILLDVLYDKNSFENIKIVNITLPDLIKSNPSSNLPVFYYYKKIKDQSLITNDAIKNYMNKRLSVGMFPPTVLKNYCLKEHFSGNEDKLFQYVLDNTIAKSRRLKYILSYLYANQDITPSDLRSILQKTYEFDNTILQDSQFRRLIMYIDMLNEK